VPFQHIFEELKRITMKLLKLSSLTTALVISLALATHPNSVRAQSILEKVKDRAKHTATQKVLSEADKAVNKGIDKAIAAPKKKNNGSEDAPVDTETAESISTVTQQASVKSFSKYDFVPGDSVIYATSFVEEALGELPAGWNSNRSSAVVSLEGLPDQWLRMAQGGVALTDNAGNFGEDFTVEFDLLMHFDLQGYLPPSFRFGLFDSGEESTTSNRFLNDPTGVKSFFVEISPVADAANLLMEGYDKHSRYFYSGSQRNSLARDWYDRPLHVAVQVQKERARVWVDGEKLYDVPKAIPRQGTLNQLFFKLSTSSYKEEQVGVYLGNLKVAKGVPDTRHQLVETGRFSTTGILFDTGSAIIKPESAGVLKSLASVLTAHEDMKVKIVGHTDSVGGDAANRLLSEQRATAVKEALESQYQINGSRLETEGKGASEPLADNNIAVGRAQNRRVEFIKL
jgi:OOP family OmpA-OmpF porin